MKTLEEIVDERIKEQLEYLNSQLSYVAVCLTKNPTAPQKLDTLLSLLSINRRIKLEAQDVDTLIKILCLKNCKDVKS